MENGPRKVLSSKAVKNDADRGREEATLSEDHASSKDEAFPSTPNVHEPRPPLQREACHSTRLRFLITHVLVLFFSP